MYEHITYQTSICIIESMHYCHPKKKTILNVDQEQSSSVMRHLFDLIGMIFQPMGGQAVPNMCYNVV